MFEWLKDHILILIALILVVGGGVACIYFPQIQAIYGGYAVAICTLALGQHVSNGYNNYLDQQTPPINPQTLPPPVVPPNV